MRPAISHIATHPASFRIAVVSVRTRNNGYTQSAQHLRNRGENLLSRLQPRSSSECAITHSDDSSATIPRNSTSQAQPARRYQTNPLASRTDPSALPSVSSECVLACVGFPPAVSVCIWISSLASVLSPPSFGNPGFARRRRVQQHGQHGRSRP